MRPFRRALGTILIGTVAILTMGVICPRREVPPPPPPPEITEFGISPSTICINVGVPIVRLSWTVEGSADVRTCMSNVTVNGQGGGAWNEDMQEGRCGEGDYDRETTFSLSDIFGNNIPSEIIIAGDLTRPAQVGVFVGTEVLDSASATMTTQTCTPGVTPGD